MKRILLILAFLFLCSFSVDARMSVAVAAGSAGTSCTAQTITWNTQPAAMTVGDADQTLNQATASGGGAVTYTSANTGICTVVSGPKLHAVGTGNCVIHASQAGNGTYCAASSVNSSDVVVSAPTPTFQFGINTTSGYSNVTGALSGVVNVIGPYTAGSSATIPFIKTYSSGNGNVKVALYADTSNTPVNSALLAVQNTSTAVVAGYNEIYFTAPYNVSAGTKYWIGLICDTTNIIYGVATSGTDYYIVLGYYTGYSFPSTWTVTANTPETLVMGAWGY